MELIDLFARDLKEAVSMVDGVNYRYFKHGKKSKATIKDCERRVDSNPSLSIAERLGVFLYSKKDNNKYTLSIGFKAIPETLIDRYSMLNGYIKIIGIDRVTVKYNINDINFSSSNTAYIPVNTISSNNRICIEYSSKEIEKLLLPTVRLVDTTIQEHMVHYLMMELTVVKCLDLEIVCLLINHIYG